MMTESLSDRLAILAYDQPLSDRRWDGRIRDLADPVNVALLVMDFETEVMMNGIADCIGNHTGSYTAEIGLALRAIGCDQQADLLQQILDAGAAVGMTHEAVQADRSALAPYTITSFRAIHGEKWDAALRNIQTLADLIDFEQSREGLEQYVQAHRSAFDAVLG